MFIKKRHYNLGFTLIELLAVMVVFLTIGMYITGIIISTLRNNNKTNAVTAVQTNGTYVTTEISKLIRNARSLTPSDTCGTIASPAVSSSLSFVNIDGNTTTFSCTTDAQNRPIISSNSAVLTDPTQVKWVMCQFTCGRNSPTDYPVIGINFTLQYVSNGSSKFVDQAASASAVPFQTAIIMRNLER